MSFYNVAPHYQTHLQSLDIYYPVMYLIIIYLIVKRDILFRESVPQNLETRKIVTFHTQRESIVRALSNYTVSKINYHPTHFCRSTVSCCEKRFSAAKGLIILLSCSYQDAPSSSGCRDPRSNALGSSINSALMNVGAAHCHAVVVVVVGGDGNPGGMRSARPTGDSSVSCRDSLTTSESALQVPRLLDSETSSETLSHLLSLFP